MLKLKLLNINLRLFDGGAAASAGAAGDGGSTTAGTDGADAGTQNQAETVKQNGSSRRSKKSGALSNVVYGKQAEDSTDTDPAAEGMTGGTTDVSTTSDTLEAKKAAFKNLVEGEYKDQFTEWTQNIIDRRFKETKNLESRLKSQQPVIDMLMSKYKIADGDINKLANAIDNDDAYWEEAAEEAGLTVEQYKNVQKLQRENETYRQMQRNAEAQRMANAQLNDWYRQAEQVKSSYPDFDFKTELSNRDFVQMLKNGIPVQKAYEVMHMDELLTGAAKTAAQTAERNTVAKIKNKSSRPSENGTSSSSSAVIKSDVSKLTKADRAEIARRVARGEIISF